MANKPWCLYLLECKGGLIYAGITNDLHARFAAHQAGTGARFTRANPPIRILGSRPYENKAEASKAEWRVKRLPKAKKIEFLQGKNIVDLLDVNKPNTPKRYGEGEWHEIEETEPGIG